MAGYWYPSCDWTRGSFVCLFVFSRCSRRRRTEQGLWCGVAPWVGLGQQQQLGFLARPVRVEGRCLAEDMSVSGLGFARRGFFYV